MLDFKYFSEILSIRRELDNITAVATVACVSGVYFTCNRGTVPVTHENETDCDYADVLWARHAIFLRRLWERDRELVLLRCKN